jgi:ATP-binding cassette subfamily B protein
MQATGTADSSDLRRAFEYVLPYWRRLLLVLVLSIIGTALSLVLPYLSKILIDDALIGRDSAALVRTVLAFAVLTLTSFALNVVSGLRYTRTSAEILFDMRLALFRHLQRLSPRFYATMPLGQIASRINSDIGEIQRVAAELLLAWVGNVLYLVGTVVILLTLDAPLFLVSLALLPPALLALVRYRRRLEQAIAAMRDRSASIGSFLIESLQGMRIVVTHNAQEREAARFRHKNDAFIDSLMGMRRLTYLSGGLPGLLLAAGSAIVFLVGGWRVIDNSITMGTLFAFITYQMRLLGPIQGLMGLYASIATARVSLRRVNEIFAAPIEINEDPSALRMESARGDVSLENVTFAFDRGSPVLDRVALDIRAGERIAIVGASGAGKSTIADLLVRHLDPDSGRILLDGQDLRRIKLHDLHRLVVVVEQEPFIFNASIAENIRYARPEASEAELAGAVRSAGLSDLVERLPQGLATSAGERGRALSAGERQRLAIARAFLADPAVLVLDEATGALDPATESNVIAGYEAIMRGRTTIIISHRPEPARRADRIVVLRDGRVVDDGTSESVLERSGFEALFVPASKSS